MNAVKYWMQTEDDWPFEERAKAYRYLSKFFPTNWLLKY